MIQRVRGTEDILDTRLLNYLIHEMKKHVTSYNFSQIKTPILEHTKLFQHSLGEHTDVVSKEMFVFDPEDKKSICLRPEATASTIRACYENRIVHFPWKVFSHGPMFRRERPQKGRLRQFHQFNIETIGTTSVGNDAYFMFMLNQLFQEVLKIENFVLNINYLGSREDRATHKEKLVAFLTENQSSICKTCLERKESNTLRIFDCKNPDCQKLYQSAPKIIDCLSTTSQKEWETLQHQLQLLSVNFVIDPKLVRGLDYYNRTVYEFTSSELGAQSAFCAGGRYSLGKQVGAKENYDCIGAAIGLERMMIILESKQNQFNLEQPPALHVILPLSDEQDALALLVAVQLQQHNLATDIIFEKASMTNMMKKANRTGAKFAIVIGENEQEQGTLTVKNMQTGETNTIAQQEIVSILKT